MLRIPALAAIAKILLGSAFAAGPNVIVVISDDQGYGDVSAHGSPHVRTPALDRFRAGSTALDRFFASPTGAASRAAVITGLHEFRGGVCHTLTGRSLLRPGIPTLPEMFRAAGYRTGIFGKWHLGDAFPCRPEDRGFEDVFVHGGGGIGQTPDHWGNGTLNPMIRRRDGWEPAEGSGADVLFNEAIGWMNRRIGEKEPFFLYLATAAPCGSWAPPRAGSGREAEDSFHAMIENIDENFRSMLEALEEGGASDETIVVFMGDNGSAFGAWNAGMKGRRGSPDEGGVRVPCFVRWPGRIETGRVVAEPTAHLDLLPTLAALCGVPRPAGWSGDGLDLSAALLGESEFPEERLLFTQVGGWPGDEAAGRFKGRDFSVRDRRWRLVGVELYDMIEDPGQTADRFPDEPAEARRLLMEYGRWWDGVLPALREPVRYRVGADQEPVTRLTAHDWWPSKEVDESRGAETVASHGAIRDLLSKTRVAATRNPLPSTSGHWKLEAVREGNYDITFSLLPPEASPEERSALGQLKAGLAHIRTGQEEIRLAVEDGATSFRIPVDLDAGPFDLEIWFDGQLLNERILGAFFATVERKGPRRAPKPELQVQPLK